MKMEAYLNIVEEILEKGKMRQNRTGIATLTIPGARFEHDMSEGFPLLTTKKVPAKSVFSELEFFVRGLTDKKWLQERGCTIWDEWHCPLDYYSENRDVPPEQKRDLGPIYGFQWRHFGASYRGYREDYAGEGIDQLANIVNTLKNNPNDRRMIVSAWNPKDLSIMALPPCHYTYHAIAIEGTLNLNWTQRSVDAALGLPFNIASYALLLHLLAKETGMKEGKLTGQLEDTHVYANHIEGMKTQLQRTPYSLPTIETNNWNGFFNWKFTDTSVKDYKSHPKIPLEVAK